MFSCSFSRAVKTNRNAEKKPRNLRNYSSRQNRSWPWTFPAVDVRYITGKAIMQWSGMALAYPDSSSHHSGLLPACSACRAAARISPSSAPCALCKHAHTDIYINTCVWTWNACSWVGESLDYTMLTEFEVRVCNAVHFSRSVCQAVVWSDLSVGFRI